MIISEGPRPALPWGRLIDTRMMTLTEYLSRTQAAWHQPPEVILARLGISPVPSEIEEMRLAKLMKWSGERAPAKGSSGVATTSRMKGLPTGPA